MCRIDGFRRHASVRVEAHDRKRLEQLCRYITRPALSDERVRLNAAGRMRPAAAFTVRHAGAVLWSTFFER